MKSRAHKRQRLAAVHLDELCPNCRQAFRRICCGRNDVEGAERSPSEATVPGRDQGRPPGGAHGPNVVTRCPLVGKVGQHGCDDRENFGRGDKAKIRIFTRTRCDGISAAESHGVKFHFGVYNCGERKITCCASKTYTCWVGAWEGQVSFHRGQVRVRRTRHAAEHHDPDIHRCLRKRKRAPAGINTTAVRASHR